MNTNKLTETIINEDIINAFPFLNYLDRSVELCVDNNTRSLHYLNTIYSVFKRKTVLECANVYEMQEMIDNVSIKQFNVTFCGHILLLGSDKNFIYAIYYGNSNNIDSEPYSFQSLSDTVFERVIKISFEYFNSWFLTDMYNLASVLEMDLNNIKNHELIKSFADTLEVIQDFTSSVKYPANSMRDFARTFISPAESLF